MTFPGSVSRPCCRRGFRVATSQRFHELGKPEVDDLRVSLLRYHDVARLEIAVHDAFFVG